MPANPPRPPADSITLAQAAATERVRGVVFEALMERDIRADDEMGMEIDDETDLIVNSLHNAGILAALAPAPAPTALRALVEQWRDRAVYLRKEAARGPGSRSAIAFNAAALECEQHADTLAALTNKEPTNGRGLSALLRQRYSAGRSGDVLVLRAQSAAKHAESRAMLRVFH